MNLNPFDLENKNIVITGASSGIGRATAVACSNAGANIVLIGRNKTELEKTVNMSSSDVQKTTYALDITEYHLLKDIIHQTTNQIGKIDGFVHCAGIQKPAPIRIMRPTDYEFLFSINVIAGLELAKIISNKRNFNNSGASFVFMASVMGFLGEASLVGYCASKGAIITACKALALELGTKRIRVNSVSPGYVKDTKMSNFVFDNFIDESKEAIRDMHPLGLGEVNDIANPIIFLLSDASRWITGTNLIVDGGYSAH